jgi:zinc protease
MATLRIDKETFQNEREVVKEERRMRVDNQPYGRLTEFIFDNAFTTHPYKHQTIGSMEDLQAASIEDVRDFYQTYYVPENATVVVVGDFDTVQAKLLAAQYFGRVPKAPRPVPRDIPQDLRKRRSEKRQVRAPGRCRRWSSRITSPTTGIRIRTRCTSPRKSCPTDRPSRIQQSLVYDKQIAVSAFGGANLIEDPNLFYAGAIVQPGHTPEEAVNA